MVGQTTLLAVRQMSAEATSMMRQIPTVTNSTPVFSCRSGGRELDVRKLSSSASRGEVFFLDIPFYRTPRSFGRLKAAHNWVAPAHSCVLSACRCHLFHLRIHRFFKNLRLGCG